MPLALDRAGEHAADEVALEGECYDDGRDHRQHAGGEHGPVVVEAELDEEARDDHRDRLRLGRAGQDQSENKLIPAYQETEDAGGDDARSSRCWRRPKLILSRTDMCG